MKSLPQRLNEANARLTAAQMALAIVQEHGSDIGGMMVAEYTKAFFLACIAVHGLENTQAMLAAISPKTHNNKPSLCVVK